MTPINCPAPLALPKQRRQRLGIRLSHPVLRRLRQYAAAKGRNESAIIEELVDEHLDTGGARHAVDAPFSPIDRLVAAIDDEREVRASEMRTLRTQLDEVLLGLALLSEAFGRFVGFWMATGPGLPTDPAQRAALTKASEARYESFARWVIDHFQRGHRFVPADMPSKPGTAPRAQGGPPGRGGGTL
jgi:hypothetical protein